MHSDVRDALQGVQYLYHYTKEKNRDSIVKDGLQGGIDGLVYCCTKKEGALAFYNMSAQSQGSLDPIIVLEISVRMLDEKNLDIGGDHSPNFFPVDLCGHVITHQGTIHPSAFVFNNLYHFAPKAYYPKEQIHTCENCGKDSLGCTFIPAEFSKTGKAQEVCRECGFSALDEIDDYLKTHTTAEIAAKFKKDGDGND